MSWIVFTTLLGCSKDDFDRTKPYTKSNFPPATIRTAARNTGDGLTEACPKSLRMERRVTQNKMASVKPAWRSEGSTCFPMTTVVRD